MSEAVADLLRTTLAACYRTEAGVLLREAERLEQTTVAELASARVPVPYRCRRLRNVEDALDAALVAL